MQLRAYCIHGIWACGRQLCSSIRRRAPISKVRKVLNFEEKSRPPPPSYHNIFIRRLAPQTSEKENDDGLRQLSAFSRGCGLLLQLNESGQLRDRTAVQEVLRLCARVAASHTQQEFLNACDPPKGCPGCFWLLFAVCLENHPSLSEDIAHVLQNLLHDRRRQIVKLVMAHMHLVRAAWSRRGDANRYPFMGNCLDFQREIDLTEYYERPGKIYFGFMSERSFSHRAGNILLSQELRVWLDQFGEGGHADSGLLGGDDLLGSSSYPHHMGAPVDYMRLVRMITKYLDEGESDWMDVVNPGRSESTRKTLPARKAPPAPAQETDSDEDWALDP